MVSLTYRARWVRICAELISPSLALGEPDWRPQTRRQRTRSRRSELDIVRPHSNEPTVATWTDSSADIPAGEMG